MDDLLMWPILNELEDEEANGGIRQRANPLTQLTGDQFLKLFRVSKELFLDIEDILTPFLRVKRINSDLDIRTRILATLRFYASGSYQNDIACNWFVGISQSSVSRSIHEVTNAFNEPAVLNRFIHFPQSIVELRNCRNRFYNKYNVPGVIGCIDCTHIAIVAPKENPEMPEHLFVNRKNYHSINVQLICDEQLKIMNIEAKYPGSTHDAFIWNNSQVNAFMQDIHERGYKDFILLGDSGYPLRPWLFTPIENEPDVNSPEARYNAMHKSVRSIIERCNGLLKARFRCCLKHRVLHYTPDIACEIINACAVLHNICINYNIPEPAGEMQEYHLDGLFENLGNPNNRHINPELVAGRIARQRLINIRF